MIAVKFIEACTPARNAMQSTILKYKEKIPSETRTILDALAEATRQALVMMLAEKNEVSFRELSRSTQPMNPSTLNHHLKALISAGLVENHYRKIEGHKDYSFYALTGLGREFLRRIGAL
ncbi:MAG: winged helix-turn-helix domain-containing protein [Nitrososphaerales archaeon]